MNDDKDYTLTFNESTQEWEYFKPCVPFDMVNIQGEKIKDFGCSNVELPDNINCEGRIDLSKLGF